MSTDKSTDDGRFRILVVEDSDDIRTLMMILLELEGYDVETARSAEEALDLLNEGRYDLVLSDYALPGHSGAWLLQEALSQRLIERPHGMLITANPYPHDAGDFEVIQKPLDFDSFFANLRDHLQMSAIHSVVRRRARARPM
jgi:two-component system response regulator GlrR